MLSKLGMILMTSSFMFATTVDGETLQQQLIDIGNHASGFQRLHAAEALVNVGATAEGADCVREAPPATQPAVGYAIVTRRILALAGVDRDRNINDIKLVALDPASTDRLHAIEALAKLKVPSDAEVQKAITEWLGSAKEEQKPFIDWLLIRWNSAGVGVLQTQLRSASTVTRQRAAYVIRSLPPDVRVPAETVSALKDAFQNEKVSAIRTTMLAALYVVSSGTDRDAWEQQIDARLTDAPPAEVAELVTVLGMCGSTRHQPLFEKLSQSHSVEVRMAALVALYRVSVATPAP